jgi:hypothetical protein
MHVTGLTGPTGPSSMGVIGLTGPTGLTGPAIGPTGPTGAIGSSRPSASVSGATGPIGPNARPSHDMMMATNSLATFAPNAKECSFRFRSDDGGNCNEITHGTLDKVWPIILEFNTPERRVGVFLIPSDPTGVAAPWHAGLHGSNQAAASPTRQQSRSGPSDRSDPSRDKGRRSAVRVQPDF